MCAIRIQMSATAQNMSPVYYPDGVKRRPHRDKRRVSAITRFCTYAALVAPFLGEYVGLTIDSVVGTLCMFAGILSGAAAPWFSRNLSLQARIIWSVFSGPLYLAYTLIVIEGMFYIVDPTYHIPWRA